MSNTTHKTVSNNSQISHNQSPNKKSPVISNPFDFNNLQMHHTTSLNPSFNNFNQTKNNIKFNHNDLYKNPMIESIDGDLPQMIESQTIEELKINQSSSSSPYLNQYKLNQSHSHFQHQNMQNHPFSNSQPPNSYQNLINSFSRHKIQISPLQQKTSQPQIKTEQNLLEDHQYDHWVLKQQSNQKPHLQATFQEQKSSELQQYLPISSKNDILSDQSQSQKVVNQNRNQQKNYSPVVNNFSRKLQASDQVVNQEISQVKYRLDQLMNKFPIESFQTGKKEGNFSKNKNISDNSAPLLQMRKTNSIYDSASLKFQSKFKEFDEVKRNPHTEGKILIMEQTSYLQTKFPSEDLLPKKSDSKEGAFSLNYSESGYHSGAEVRLPKQQIDSLYQQINEQAESIQTYKQMILRLENQNINLVNTIEVFQRSYHQHSNCNGNVNSLQQLSPQPNDLQKTNFLDHPDSGRKGSYLSDSFHKFEREESNASKLHASRSQNLEVQSSHNRPTKMKSSSKISPNLEHQVEILESEKTELLKKIDWLNSVVEEMMNMGNRIKTQKSLILDNVPASEYRNSKRSRQFSGDIGKVSRVIQTSFMDSSDGFGIQNPNYKELYEKEIEYQQHMKQEINQLSELQDAYAVHFKKILQQINEIKKNRAYYQELKKEIQRSKEKSLRKNEAQRRSRSPVIHYQPKENSKRVFENQVIYQLKSQNEYLLSKYLNLKQLYAKEKAISNKLDVNNNEMNISLQTIQPEESIIEQTTKNVFINQNLKKKQKILERDSKVSDFYVQKERPGSYGNFNLPITNRTQESRAKMFQKRKNGSIYGLSQVEDTTKSRKNLLPEKHKGQYHPGQLRNLSTDCDRQYYQQVLQKVNLNEVARKNIFTKEETISRVVQGCLGQGIVEEQKQPSSNCTYETSHHMIGRYNNFIKNMKMRFGINSSIIGKEITIHEDRFNH